jgi:hypothetical protein
MRTLVSMMMATLLATHAYADDKHHPPEAAAKPAQGKQAAQTPTAVDKRFTAAYDQMKKMMGQMDKIKATKDPQERQRLMHEHMDAMHEGLQALRPTGGGAMQMMGCQMMKEKEAKDKSDAMTCPMMGDARPKPSSGERLEMMEKRMDMMQMMMEQMVEREGQKPVPKQ